MSDYLQKYGHVAMIVLLIVGPTRAEAQKNRMERPVVEDKIESPSQRRFGETFGEYLRRATERQRHSDALHREAYIAGRVVHYTRGVRGINQLRVSALAWTLVSKRIMPVDLDQAVKDHAGEGGFHDKVAAFVRALAIAGVYEKILSEKGGQANISDFLFVPGRPKLRLVELLYFLRYSVVRNDPKMASWLERLTAYTLEQSVPSDPEARPDGSDVHHLEEVHGHPSHSCVPVPPNLDLAGMDESDAKDCE